MRIAVAVIGCISVIEGVMLFVLGFVVSNLREDLLKIVKIHNQVLEDNSSDISSVIRPLDLIVPGFMEGRKGTRADNCVLPRTSAELRFSRDIIERLERL